MRDNKVGLSKNIYLFVWSEFMPIIIVNYELKITWKKLAVT